MNTARIVLVAAVTFIGGGCASSFQLNDGPVSMQGTVRSPQVAATARLITATANAVEMDATTRQINVERQWDAVNSGRLVPMYGGSYLGSSYNGLVFPAQSAQHPTIGSSAVSLERIERIEAQLGNNTRTLEIALEPNTQEGGQ